MVAVNTRTEYALRALLEIAAKDAGTVSAQVICDKQQLPKKYVEHLLNALKNAGLITSFAGSRGGYTLSRPESEINLQDVLDAVEDSSPELSCDMQGKFCLGESCGLDVLFSEITLKQRDLLRTYTLDRIKGIKSKGCK